jgi:hypothetical protein
MNLRLKLQSKYLLMPWSVLLEWLLGILGGVSMNARCCAHLTKSIHTWATRYSSIVTLMAKCILRSRQIYHRPTYSLL